MKKIRTRERPASIPKSLSPPEFSVACVVVPSSSADAESERVGRQIRVMDAPWGLVVANATVMHDVAWALGLAVRAQHLRAGIVSEVPMTT